MYALRGFLLFFFFPEKKGTKSFLKIISHSSILLWVSENPALSPMSQCQEQVHYPDSFPLPRAHPLAREVRPTQQALL